MNLQTSGAVCRENAEPSVYVVPAQAGTQYSETSVMESKTRGVLDTRLRGYDGGGGASSFRTAIWPGISEDDGYKSPLGHMNH
jgi:hypothetical protein